MAVACVEAQPIRVIHRFNTDVGVRVVRRVSTEGGALTDAIPFSQGLLITARTVTGTERELISKDGKSLARTTASRRVLKTLVDGDRVTSIEEISPGVSVVVQGKLGEELGIVSHEDYWTDLVRAPSGDILAVKSHFVAWTGSTPVSLSDCHYHNLTWNRPEFVDDFSYQIPIAGRDLLLVSIKDRKVRRLSGGIATEIGSVNGIENLPIVSPSGRWTAWFGPVGTSSALFISQPTSPPIILDPQSPDRPMVWLGEDLLVAFQDELSRRWTLKLFSVPDGLIHRTFSVPPNVDPQVMLSSPAGDFIGLPTDRGSILIRVSDNFIQTFDRVSLSEWHWSPDGSLLYILTQKDLSVVALR